MISAISFRAAGLLLGLSLGLSGCTTLQRLAHGLSDRAPQPLNFQFEDGVSSVHYELSVGTSAQPDTVLFFYGGSGCPSWKYVMPDYVRGLPVDARVFVLNKRFVADRGTGLFGCGREFHLANHPAQWAGDYARFIDARLRALPWQPRRVVLVGVSEGALVAARVAHSEPRVTHLALIGAGGYSLRRSLEVLREQGAIAFDVAAGARDIAADPRSLDKTWYGQPYRWWSEVLDLRLGDDLLALEIPVLLGVGEADRSVPVESARALAAEFQAAGKRNLRLELYPGADHRLSAPGVEYLDAFFRTLGELLRGPAEAGERPSSRDGS